MLPISSGMAGSSTMVGFMLEPNQANFTTCRQQQHNKFVVPKSIATAALAAESRISSFEDCKIDALLRDSAEALINANTSFCNNHAEEQGLLLPCAFDIVHGNTKAAQSPKKPTTAETVCSQALGVKKAGTINKAQTQQLIKPNLQHHIANSSPSHISCTRKALREAITARSASKLLQDGHDGKGQV
jgi:hypothetical protein